MTPSHSCTLYQPFARGLVDAPHDGLKAEAATKRAVHMRAPGLVSGAEDGSIAPPARCTSSWIDVGASSPILTIGRSIAAPSVSIVAVAMLRQWTALIRRAG